jgi:hypothetical protein
MRLNDIISENEVTTDEAVLQGLKGLAKNLTTPIKGWQSGYAQGQGADQTKEQATALFQEFYRDMGRIGQQPTVQDLIDYLNKKHYPTTAATAILNNTAAVQGNADPVIPAIDPKNPAANVGANTTAAKMGSNTRKISKTRGVQESLDAALSVETAWKAIIAATQENIKLGSRGSQAGAGNFSAGVSRGSDISSGPSSTNNLRLTPSGSADDIQSVLNFYKNLDSNGKLALRKQFDVIDSELSSTSKPTPPVAESPVGYSRFLGMKL